MAAMIRIALTLLTATALGSPAAAQSGRNLAGRDLGTVLAEINHGFVCPEFQPDDAVRRADMLAFSRALASVGPTRITYRQAAYIHAKMLDTHNCGGTSGTVASAVAAEAATGVAN